MIVLSTTPAVTTQERFQLDFYVDGRTWEGYFDRLEVWRSQSTDQGPYEPLHADTWLPARLPVGNDTAVPPSPAQDGPSVPLVGLTLQFLLDASVPVNVTFTGSNPLTFGQAATQIQAQSLGLLTAFVLGSTLIVQTVEAGLKATLLCSGGTAAPLLGLPTVGPDALAYGRDARIVLKHGEQDYSFVDPNGSASFFYRARFFNSFAETVSQWSAPFQGTTPQGLDNAALCRGFVRLVDLTGEPAAGQEVLIHNNFNGQQVEGQVVVGGDIQLLTDSKGYAEVLLARGASITVGIGGTSLARDVVVPTDPAVESFDLLASAGASNDLFAVQVPSIPYAVRRTL